MTFDPKELRKIEQANEAMKPQTKENPSNPIASHEEVLRILTEQARGGSVTAAAALARELRQAEKRDSEVDETIDRILAK